VFLQLVQKVKINLFRPFLSSWVGYAAGLSVDDEEGFNGWVKQGFVQDAHSDHARGSSYECFDCWGHCVEFWIVAKVGCQPK